MSTSSSPLTNSMSDHSDTISDISSTPELPPSPSRRRPPPLRLTEVGIDPGTIVGKVLKRVRRSSTHPVLTLDFDDNTTYQILVDGYDPVHKGVPKELEMDPVLDSIFANDSNVDLHVVDCALITLSDKAFQRNQLDQSLNSATEQQWDQNHLGVAFKFAGENSRWHCVWATMQEYDEGSCVFRSYDDVYLDRLQRSPRKKSHVRKRSMAI